jgi:O-antigen/teichoic acid export membrane protein
MRPGEPMEWRNWLGRVIPLTTCLGITPLLTYADSLIVTALLPQQLDKYTSASTVGRGLILLTAPLIAVMFPMLVRNIAKSEKSNVLSLALFSAVGLAVSVVIFLTFFLKPIFILFYPDPKYIDAIPLISRYAWAVFPLAIGNVLLSNLLAQRKFDVAWALLIVPAGYLLALTKFHASLGQIITVMGITNVVYLLVNLVFTGLSKASGRPS